MLQSLRKITIVHYEWAFQCIVGFSLLVFSLQFMQLCSLGIFIYSVLYLFLSVFFLSMSDSGFKILLVLENEFGWICSLLIFEVEEDWCSSLKVWWTSALVCRFSLLVTFHYWATGVFMFSVSSWFSFGKLWISRN